MTTAVLHSYDRAGMRMDDHYTATEKFHKWFQAEARKGRFVLFVLLWAAELVSAAEDVVPLVVSLLGAAALVLAAEDVIPLVVVVVLLLCGT